MAQPEQQQRVNFVLRRLESRMQKDKKQPPNTLFSSFSPEAVKQALNPSLTFDEAQKDQHKLLAFLFLQARETITGKFSSEQEEKAIDGVCRYITGESRELGTGTGKSSMVIPIYFLYRRMIDVDGSDGYLYCVPPNQQLLRSTVSYYEKIRNKVIDKINKPGLKKQIAERTDFEIDRPKREKEKNKDLFIDAFTQRPKRQYSLGDQKKLIFSTPETVIHETLVDQHRPVSVYFFDEAHQLHNEQFVCDTSNHPFELTRTQLKQDEFIQNDIAYFILGKLTTETIISNRKTLTKQGNNYHLTDRCIELLEGLDNKIKRKTIDKNIESIIIKSVLPGFRLKKQDNQDVLIKEIKDIFYEYFSEFNKNKSVPESADLSSKNLIISLADDLAEILGGIKKGKDYLIGRKKVSVRDSRRGTIKSSHQFESTTESLIRIVDDEGIYQYRPPTGIIYNFSFPSWLHLVGKNRTLVTSANLASTDLRTGKKTKNQFTSAFEELSESLISFPEQVESRLPLPNPEVFSSTPKLLKSLKEKVAIKKPHLIVCFNDFFAEDISTLFPDKKVKVIKSRTSEKDVKLILQQFAEGEIDILITSGRASYGVDIKTKSGLFPDFNVVLINPETQTDINQAFGRIRGTKKRENFSLLFEEDFLNDVSTLLYEKNLLFSKSSRKYFLKLLEEYKKNPEIMDRKKLLDSILYLLQINENKQNTDYINQIKTELAFYEKVMPFIKKTKQEVINNLINIDGSLLNQILKKHSSEDNNFINRELVRALNDYLSFVDEQAWELFQSDVSLSQYNPRLMSYAFDDILNHTVLSWFENKDLKNHWEGLLNHKTYLGYFNIEKYLKEQKTFYEQLFSLIKENNPRINEKKIKNIDFLSLPDNVDKIMNPKAPAELRVVDEQKLIKTPFGYYLILVNYRDGRQKLFITQEKDRRKNKNSIYYIAKEVDIKKLLGQEQGLIVAPRVKDMKEVTTLARVTLDL